MRNYGLEHSEQKVPDHVCFLQKVARLTSEGACAPASEAQSIVRAVFPGRDSGLGKDQSDNCGSQLRQQYFHQHLQQKCHSQVLLPIIFRGLELNEIHSARYF